MRLPILAALMLAASPVHAEMRFEPRDIAAWPEHSFMGETRYRTVQVSGEPAVHAVCEGNASGLFLEREIDLTATPVLEWRWRVAERFPGDAPERTKPGDDFAARVYVVREGLLPWQTRALNYVWARAEPVGADWPNPFASQAHMIVLRAGPADGWHTERRDLRADFAQFHDIEPARVDAVAIMTDCDNTGGRAEAWYGRIRFLPDDPG
jgi:hypothetical protein